MKSTCWGVGWMSAFDLSAFHSIQCVMTSEDGTNGLKNGFWWTDGLKSWKKFWWITNSFWWSLGKLIMTTSVVFVCRLIMFEIFRNTHALCLVPTIWHGSLGVCQKSCVPGSITANSMELFFTTIHYTMYGSNHLKTSFPPKQELPHSFRLRILAQSNMYSWAARKPHLTWCGSGWWIASPQTLFVTCRCSYLAAHFHRRKTKTRVWVLCWSTSGWSLWSTLKSWAHALLMQVFLDISCASVASWPVASKLWTSLTVDLNIRTRYWHCHENKPRIVWDRDSRVMLHRTLWVDLSGVHWELEHPWIGFVFWAPRPNEHLGGLRAITFFIIGRGWR